MQLGQYISSLMTILLILVPAPFAYADEFTIESTLLQAGSCSSSFTEHALPYMTTTRQEIIRFYESNGSGLGINDLNDDGLMDIVFANLHGRNTILWNIGRLTFEAQAIGDSRSRAVNIIDVNGDNRLDITFTHSLTAPTYWQNQGQDNNGQSIFKRTILSGMREAAYAMTWGDVDRDGDLDAVSGSYDAELEKELGNSFLFSKGAGVFYYEQGEDGSFMTERLSQRAQTLALWLSDFDDNGTMELIAGNDFTLPDQAWAYQNDIWQETPDFFSVTTLSTMSFDAGDVNNDGRAEFFAADMQPISTDAAILAAWKTVLERLESAPRLPGDKQIIANILQIADANEGYNNLAAAFGVDASGWSWSSKFGDLDSNGFLDLYVVNGMIAQDIFRQLPGSALIEPNQAFRNENGQRFLPAPEWGLNSDASGRGMSMGDMDNDGDLDMVVNNLGSPAQLFENQLCGGQNLLVNLRWTYSRNTYALGAIVTLYTSTGTYRRDIRASSGYLSGDPAQAHFGIPFNSTVSQLEIRWPDGVTSVIDTPTTNSLYTIIRSSFSLAER